MILRARLPLQPKPEIIVEYAERIGRGLETRSHLQCLRSGLFAKSRALALYLRASPNRGTSASTSAGLNVTRSNSYHRTANEAECRQDTAGCGEPSDGRPFRSLNPNRDTPREQTRTTYYAREVDCSNHVYHTNVVSPLFVCCARLLHDTPRTASALFDE